MPVTAKTRAIAKFRDAPADVAPTMVTCGFELETQESAGVTKGDIDGETNHEAMRDAADESASYYARHAAEAMVNHSDYFPRWIRDAVNGSSAEWGALRTLVNGRSLEQLERVGMIEDATSIESDIADSIHESLDESDYRDEDSPENYFRSRLPATVEAGEDGTVSGFEFRTIGAVTAEEFQDAAKRLFKIDHVIDTQCSFHVHVAVKGVTHQYGPRMQEALTEYLLNNMERVPESVRERWTRVATWKYFTPGISTQKYSFVFKHEQGTWEFRCFGNVKNANDATTCLALAIEALQYAYRRAKTMRAVYGLSHQEWQNACIQSMETSRPLSDVVHERRRQTA